MPPASRTSSATRQAERFSYYGMNSILVPFMTHHLLTAARTRPHLRPAQSGRAGTTRSFSFLYFIAHPRRFSGGRRVAQDTARYLTLVESCICLASPGSRDRPHGAGLVSAWCSSPSGRPRGRRRRPDVERLRGLGTTTTAARPPDRGALGTAPASRNEQSGPPPNRVDGKEN